MKFITGEENKSDVHLTHRGWLILSPIPQRAATQKLHLENQTVFVVLGFPPLFSHDPLPVSLRHSKLLFLAVA
jgi:hypothetical protein